MTRRAASSSPYLVLLPVGFAVPACCQARGALLPHHFTLTCALPPLCRLRKHLAGFAGKPTVVNLWTTWCPPCRREMPVLEQAQAANPDANIVFVNQGEEAATIAAFLDRHGLALRNVLVDPQRRTGAALGHRALPTTLFFDAQGRLADTRIGELSQATLTQRLTSLRAASPPTQRLTSP